MSRQLIHIPIIHSPTDMGTMLEEIKKIHIKQLGRKGWDNYVAMIPKFWQTICTSLDAMKLNYNLVDLYQDGLPVCGKELEIVKDMAASGSENHQFLLELIDRGATLMGTEGPRYLLEAYHKIQNSLKNQTSDDDKTLVARRDAYIAKRINESLIPGRTGILFLGQMHNIEGANLDKDIVLTHKTFGF